MARNILVTTGNYSVAKSSDREVTFFKFRANLLSKLFLVSLQFDNMIRLVAIHHEDLLADTHIHLAKVQCGGWSVSDPQGEDWRGDIARFFFAFRRELYLCAQG